MKANEAPEKLYMNWVNYPLEEMQVEYTRTDAIINKALAFIRSCTTYDGLGYKAKCVNIEDFKNYMKRE